MRKALSAAAVLAIVAASPVLAQTTPPPVNPPPTATPLQAAPSVPVTPGMPAPGATTSNSTMPGTVLKPGVADSSAITTPLPTTTDTAKVPPGAPLAGANSFTESQAKARIEAKGFSNVTGLKKDDGSIWRGQAMKDGKSVNIALDYQGNVVAN